MQLTPIENLLPTRNPFGLGLMVHAYQQGGPLTSDLVHPFIKPIRVRYQESSDFVR